MSQGMKNPCVGIIQARLGSSRLPLKSLLSLRDLPIIDWVVQRVGRARRLDKIVVAIPDTSLDQVLAAHLTRHGVPCIMGDENDVLGRFSLAAAKTDAGTIVRICADNPLIWWEALDRLVEHFETNPCDYAYNHIPRKNLWPDGLGAEILSRDLLDELNDRARFPSQREHCMNYIWDNACSYRISTFNPHEEWLLRPDIKLDIDRAEDFERLALLPISPDIEMRDLIRLFPTHEHTA